MCHFSILTKSLEDGEFIYIPLCRNEEDSNQNVRQKNYQEFKKRMID